MPFPVILINAFGIAGKLAAKPALDAALRREHVIRALRTLHLDPHQPPRDFDSLYAYTVIEYCSDRPKSVLAFFRDEYVLEAFRRSFATPDNWTRLRDETTTALERNRETKEFGPLGSDFAATHLDGFIAAFQNLVDRSRAPHETRIEQKVDALLERVSQTRDEEEGHRARTEPGRADLSPAARLASDVSDWFVAVGYEIRRNWKTDDGSVALLVDVPQRRPGRFDRMVMLCVEGELAPYHMRSLDTLVSAEQAHEGWGLAHMRISQAARQSAAASDDRLFCYTFDELIELEADFEPYVTWVVDEVRRRRIDTRYVPLSCRKDEIDPSTQQPLDTSVYDWREGGLDDYVASWLEDPAKKHLSLLGEFGMGKSWFALHLAGSMAHIWKDARSKRLPRPRIPLLIPLRDYAKQTSVEALLSDFFFNKHKINLRNYEVFRVLNRMGRLLLIFDGFDEMAARVDRNTVVANFWELAKAVEPGAKVLLSSRTEYFPDAQVARDLFNAKSSASVLREDGPTFEIVELVPFDDDQIERMLGHDLDENKVRTIMDNDEVRDLMRRPVMSELVIDALPEIEQGAEIDLARIYLYAIQRKMDRDIKHERTFTSRGDKVYFLCEVAWEMLSSDRLSLNYRDFPDRLRAFFGPAVQSARDLDYWEQDMRNQGMLVRNAEGDYGPSHKSLLEFLVAFKFAAELDLLGGNFLSLIPGAGHPEGEKLPWSVYFSRRGEDGSQPALASFDTETLGTLGENFGALGQNHVVYQFLAAMAREHADFRGQLLDVVQATRGTLADITDSPDSLVGNCANLILAAGGTLEEIDLSSLYLAGFEPKAFTSKPTLAGAVLRECDLSRVDLATVDLAGADLSGAHLRPDVLADLRFRQDGLAHPQGALVVHADDEVWHWPTGSLTEPPLRIRVGRLNAHDQSPLAYWDKKTWAYYKDFRWSLVDAATGQPVGTTAETIGFPMPWRGRIALGEWDRSTLTIRDCGDGSVLATLPSVDYEVSQSRSTSYFTSGYGGPSLLETTPGTLIRYLVCGDDEANPWQAAAQLEHSYQPGRIIRGNDCGLEASDRLAFLAFDAESPHAVVSAIGIPLPDLPLDKARTFLFRAGSGMAAIVTDSDLYVWNLSETTQLQGGDEVNRVWQLNNVPGGIFSIWSSPTGDRLVMLSRMGDLAVHDFRTGELLSRRMLTTRLEGTRFSSNCGFDDLTLDAITRAGGVIVA